MPAIVYFHGGGHVIGSLDTHDFVARNLCGGTGAMVASVDYRMGPEHKFPAAVDDCFAALQWVHANAASLGADPDRIGVHGDSAGGNLAAVTALLARDAGGPRLRLQSLVYPVTDYGLTGHSYDKYASGYGILTKAATGLVPRSLFAPPRGRERLARFADPRRQPRGSERRRSSSPRNATCCTTTERTTPRHCGAPASRSNTANMPA